LRDDIAYAKRVGFDLLRVHIKVDDPLLLYYADTIGMLLMCDMPNFGEGGDTPTGRRRYEEMMRAAIARDFNHPSIVAWCLFNETWGFGGQTDFAHIINPHLRVSDAAVPLTKNGQANERSYV
jgi:beta-galactosidase/beta-glucuronidase